MSAFVICGFVAICAIATGLVYLLIYGVKKREQYKKAIAFRGPSGIPILGNALHFLGDTEDILRKITDFSKLYPSPFRVWSGPQLLIFISEPDELKTILSSPKMIEKADVYKFFRPWLGNGLFSAPAKIWRARRKLIGPTFNLKILESFVSVFSARAKRMVERMKNELDGPDFEVYDYTSMCTLEIICEAAMGVDMKENSADSRDYARAANTVMGIVYKRIFKVWLHPDVIFNNTELGKEQKKCIKILHNFTNTVIQKKRSALLNNNKNLGNDLPGQKSNDEDPTFQRKAYLDHLMQLLDGDKKFSDAELREEVDNMVIAGTDTSSTVLCFIMLMLAYHPDIQEKVHRELCDIYGTCDIDERDVTCEDLSLMSYMECVIKETLRLFPIGPIIARVATEDVDIGEYTVPQEALLVVNVLSLHRSEKYWPDPLRFDPNRFSPEEIASRHPYSYIPFSAGPRNCIGARFAMMEMKTILANVLRRYILKTDNIVPINDIKLVAETLLRPRDTIKLRIERR